MSSDRRVEARGSAPQAAPSSIDAEVARLVELEKLRAEFIEAEHTLEDVRERIRSLGGLDPASEAGLP